MRISPRLTFALMTVSMYVQLVIVFGFVASAAIVVFQSAHEWLSLPWLPAPMQIGFAAACAFLGATFSLAALVVCIIRIFGLRVTVGEHRVGSIALTRWALYNFYILLFRYTLMNFIRATPLQPWFYRLLGAKLGRGVQMNTLHIADCNLITIGDFSMVGGDATIVCHSFERGHMVVRPITIGAHVDIGMNSIVLPGTTIGDHAIIAANAVIPKNTTVPAYTVWAGVPAQQIRERHGRPHGLC